MNKVLEVSKRVALAALVLSGVAAAVIAAAGLFARGPGEAAVPAGHERNGSLYLTTRDGTQLAVDVWYPAGLERGERVPALVRSTRYARALEPGFAGRALLGLGAGRMAGRFTGEGLPLALGGWPDGRTEAFNEAGYAVVLVDARGSGASFGRRDVDYSPEEVGDLGEVVDWIVAQGWSDGRVGAFGVSYEGNTAELITVPNRPAVEAVAPLYSDFDPFRYLAMPGGAFDRGFVEGWDAANDGLDRNDLCAAFGTTGFGCLAQGLLVEGVKPVVGEEGRLEAAVAEHAANYDVGDTLKGFAHYDDEFPQAGLTAKEISPYGLEGPIGRSGAAMHARVGWLDAATADGALGRYNTLPNPQHLVIGPWSHGGRHDTDPFADPDRCVSPTTAGETHELVSFFDARLKGGESPAPRKRIDYYTTNGGGWKTTGEWPPRGFENKRWYFGPGGSLEREAPTERSAADRYEVDFSATTGEASRWDTNLGGGDVVYPDRAREDEKLLTYTGPPLEGDAEITGSPVVTLYASSTAADGALHVYLEDVAPDGRVTYLTEGNLRTLHRKVSEEEPPYEVLGPHRSFKREDAEPLVPGEVAEYEIALYATSVRLERGHRIRVAVAGHDASTFARYPADEDAPVVLSARRDAARPSHVDLPVKGR